MKKIVAVLLAAACLVTLFACSLAEKGEDIQKETDVAETTGALDTGSENIPEPTVQETTKETEPIPETTKEETTVFETETQPPVETQPLPPSYVQVTGITLTVYDITFQVGDTQMPIVTMAPYNATDKGEIWVSSDTAVATVDMYGNITGVGQGSCTVTVTSTSNSKVFATVTVKVNPGATPTYIDGILVVNKTYPLPKSYAPGWDAEASSKMWEMFGEAQKAGLYLRVQSGYRSYIDQTIIYNGYVARDGQAAADRYSARPGHSEHQSGLAFDVNTNYYEGLTTAFGQTPEGLWLAANCHKYGFIIRYPADKEHITGYMYEPWHIRYLGVEKATAVYESGLCLEEYLNITSSYS